MVRLTDRPDMTLDVYRGRETTIQQQQQQNTPFAQIKLLDVSCNVCRNVNPPSFQEDTFHSSHLPQLFLFMMLAYVYIIVLTVG